MKKSLCFALGAALVLVLVCLAVYSHRVQSEKNWVENRVVDTIQDMMDRTVYIKYVNDGGKLYYKIAAVSEEFIQQLDLQNWQLKELDNDLVLDEYLVVRIAEKYEIVICSNQIGKIYDYYGAYGTHNPETLFYKTTPKLQEIINCLDQHASKLATYNIGFEN